MELFANELSIHGQFFDVQSFRDSFSRILVLQRTAKRFGRDIQCSRSLLLKQPIAGMQMSQAIGQFSHDERRSIMVWLTSRGPFWDDLRQHDPSVYFECSGEVVTDTAVGEAAFRLSAEVQCALVSFTPSDWDFSPVEVALRKGEYGSLDQIEEIPNWRTVSELEEGLSDAEPTINTWYELQMNCYARFRRIHFAESAFENLNGVPFARSSMFRIFKLLEILDQRAGSFDTEGAPTAEAHRLDQDYFIGSNSLFSDSSETEKQKYRTRLTFRHPIKPEESIWCPWHGKEHHSLLRVHFSWPIRPTEPVYVVYVGPKLTKH